MGKLTKKELAAHDAALALIETDRPLTLDERIQCYEDWHEGATSNQTAAQAFFTPCDMASDLRLEMPARGSFVDLCAGTGRLAFFAGGQAMWEQYRHQYERIVCVERNAAYVEIGKRLFPEAEWICGDALDPAVLRQIGTVDQAIMNPPFGTTAKSEFTAPRYRGKLMDLKIMDAASTVAPRCIAIVPSDRAAWDWKGDYLESKTAEAFYQATGLDLYRFSSIEPEYYRDQWRGVSPSVELVAFGSEYEAEGWTTRNIHGAPEREKAPQGLLNLEAGKAA